MEVCIGNVWGTVCHRSWDTNDARVVCRQQGFEVDGECKVNYTVLSWKMHPSIKMECIKERVMQCLDVRTCPILPITQVHITGLVHGMDKGLGPYF